MIARHRSVPLAVHSFCSVPLRTAGLLACAIAGTLACTATPHDPTAAAATTDTGRASDPDAAVPDDVGALFEKMGVTLLAAEKRVEIAGWVNMQTGLVEVFACSPGGKTHEAVVVLDCVPRGLHAALLALGLRPGTPAEEGNEGDYRPPTGDRVDIWVRWHDAAGEVQRTRAESWIWNKSEQRSMPAAAWIFAGSLLQPAPEGGDVYAADYVKSLVTTYHDATSILENPHTGGIDDTLYYSNEHAVPPVGTPVVVEFLPTGSGS